jgi:Ser/Thr protein kinase RdoA (MazF antagonist)
MERGALDAVLPLYRHVLPAQRTYRPVERPGFSGALVFRIETAAGHFCLRGWPLATQAAEKILALHEFLAIVRAQGIDYIAVPVAADGGRTLVGSCGRFWQLEPWLPGEADFWSRPSEVRLAAAFNALARFHRAAIGFQPAGGKPSHLGPASQGTAPTVLDRLERIDGWTADRLAELRKQIRDAGDDSRMAALAEQVTADFERRRSEIARELRAAAHVPVFLQPCLRDVWHDHVLFQNDAVTGLIDLSAARTDTVAADISRLAGSLIADDRRAWEVALDAYRGVRPLSADEVALCGVLDRSGVLLSGMAWLERRYFERLPLTERARDRLERIVARLEAASALVSGAHQL